ncbi:MAG: InlB B-repeat-containing protein [Lachnospiraceae bacterium]|nr:InlB B-repeat-containing protein [Lachnospiraceae bacterium]
MQSARYVKIVQTGNKGLYWSIHEFNLKNLVGTPQDTTFTVSYYDGDTLVDSQTFDDGQSVQTLPKLEKDGYIFAGWYTQKVTLNSVSAVSAAASKAAAVQNISDDTALYAGWINIGTGNKSFELLGTQIRTTEPTGLRFITQIGTTLIAQIEALNAANASLQPDSTADKGIGFGTVVTMASLVGNAQIEKDVNVTKVTKGMAVCPAVKLFERTDDYYQYTAVVTGITARHYQTDIAARPYITYRDANGIERTYYYTEKGTNAGGGYSVSIYTAAKAFYANHAVSNAVKQWLYNNIISVVEG